MALSLKTVTNRVSFFGHRNVLNWTSDKMTAVK